MAVVSRPAPNVVAIEGEVDLHESQTVKDGIAPLIDEKQPRIVVDMGGVSYIDSSGIAVLIDALQRIHAYGGQLHLCNLRETVNDIFQIARLDQVFKIFPDRGSAAD